MTQSRKLPKTDSNGGATLKENHPGGLALCFRIKCSELITPLSYTMLNYSAILHNTSRIPFRANYFSTGSKTVLSVLNQPGHPRCRTAAAEEAAQ